MKKIKSYFVFFIVLYFSGQLFSQNKTFEVIIDNGDNLMCTDMVEDSSGIVYFTVISNKVNNTIQHSLVGRMNAQGELLDTIRLANPNKSRVLYNIHEKEPGVFILTGVEFDPDTENNVTILIYLISNNLAIIDSAKYYLPPNEQYRYISSNYEMNGHLLLSGGYFSGTSFSDSYSFVMILNEEMDSIGFNEFERHLGISFFKQLDDNQYWVIEEVAKEICILDSTLTKVEIIDIPDYIFGNYSVKWDSDTSFYLLGYNLYPHPSYNIALLRFYHPIDTSGYQLNLLRVSDTTDYPCARDGVGFISNDTIFAGGTRNLNTTNPYYSNQPSWFMLFQTDSQLNVRWERFYGGDAYYVMRNLIATRDGGCLIAGTRYDYMNDPVPQTDIIVLKLNSEGLLVGNNEQPETRMHEAIVFPNPGTEALQVRLAVQHPTALLELFDTNGRLVFSQQLHQKENRIAVGHLPAGTYIYNLSADTGLRESGRWVKL
jgi:hypothetical protein